MPRVCVHALAGTGADRLDTLQLWWLDPEANSDGASALSLSVRIGRRVIAQAAATRSPRREATISSAATGGSSARPIRLAGRLEFRCPACGYGVVVSAEPPSACPMCHASAWTPIAASRAKGH